MARECSEVNLVFAPVIRRRSKGQRAVHSRTRGGAPIWLIVTALLGALLGSSPDSERGTGQPPVPDGAAGLECGNDPGNEMPPPTGEHGGDVVHRVK